MKGIKVNKSKNKAGFNPAKMIFAVTILVIIAFVILRAFDKPNKYIVVYYPFNTAETGYTPDKLPWDKVTHILCPVVICQSDGSVVFSKFFTPELAESNFKQINQIRWLHPKVKVILCLQGNTDDFNKAAASEEGRNKLADNSISWIRKYKLDGLDLDWENFTAEHKDNYLSLIKKLRQKLDFAGVFDSKRYMLTIAAPHDAGIIGNFQPDKIHPYLDFISVMGYDERGPGWDFTGHHSGLYRNPQDPSEGPQWAERSVNIYLNTYHVPPSKLLLGCPFYAVGWRDVSGGINGLFGTTDRSYYDMTVRFSEIRSKYQQNPEWTTYHDPSAGQAVWMWNPYERIMYSFDDEISIKTKTDYITRKGLGGFMCWEITGDYNNLLIDTVYNEFKKYNFE